MFPAGAAVVVGASDPAGAVVESAGAAVVTGAAPSELSRFEHETAAVSTKPATKTIRAERRNDDIVPPMVM